MTSHFPPILRTYRQISLEYADKITGKLLEHEDAARVKFVMAYWVMTRARPPIRGWGAQHHYRAPHLGRADRATWFRTRPRRVFRRVQEVRDE